MSAARKHGGIAVLALAAALWLTGGAAWAIHPDEILKNPRLEARARSIGKELRCLVCQNESIDDSEADLAHDLRIIVRQRLVAGDTDDQVKQYIVARYGNYVLLRPPFDLETYLLWLGPLALFLAGGASAFVYYRRTALAADALPLSEDERRRLGALVGEGESGRS
ncbi:MAG TPA: cytochrome c-type biogenesis protein [Rhizomicrobium sp.]|nr:cytochrome c-type biogenesis protein [Rhizomicrobium sp.]